MISVSKYRYLPIFRDIPAKQLEQIGSLLELRAFSGSETIFQQGAEASFLYILLSGKVSIRYKPYDGPALTFANIIPGWVFGWSAALGRRTYTSAAIALLPGYAFSLSKENLHEICLRNDETGIIFLDRLTTIIADRLNQTPKQILSILAWVTDKNTEG